MTFKDITFKNFKMNFRDYFAYFLCGVFSITIFFMYATLLFNDAINEKTKENEIIIIFILSIMALTVFSIFFINYAHASFIKSRNKEFGIYMSLGMTGKNLIRMILNENIIMFLMSMSSGLFVGVFLSKILQTTAIKLLDLEGVEYSLNYKSFASTFIVFLIIYLIAQILTEQKLKKLDITQILKESQKNENILKKSDSKLGVLGVLLIIASVIMVVAIAGNEDYNTNPIIIISYIGISFLGIYLTISYVGNTIISFLKGSIFYYRNIISITEIHYKFNRNKNIIFVLSILSAVTIFLVASPFSLLQLSGDVAERNIYDLEFVAKNNINNIEMEALDNIIMDSNIVIVGERVECEFISLQYDLEASKYDLLHSKPIISQSNYNALTGKNLQLSEGEAINIITIWEPGTHGIDSGSTVNFTDGNKLFSFNVIESYHGEWISSVGSYPSSSGIIISDLDYQNLIGNINSDNVGKYYGWNFESWKNSSVVIDNIKEKIEALNGVEKSQFFPVISTLSTYNELKKNYSLFVFVTLLIGILFFVAGGMVLYFKQYTELNQSKKLFKKLYKIGISKKEVESIITKECFVTFFTPLVMGSIFGYCFIYLVTNVVSGSDVLEKFMKNTTLVVIAYFIFQLAFYLITKRKYSKEVNIESLGGL